jgi:hypothetical protein
METPIQPIGKHQYIFVRAYWQGRISYLTKTARVNNPFADPVNQLAWWMGWDDEYENAHAFECIHDWEPDAAGAYCFICGIRKP